MGKKTSHDEISKGFSEAGAQIKQNNLNKRKIWSITPKTRTLGGRNFSIIRYDKLMAKYKITKSALSLIEHIFKSWKNYQEIYQSNSELAKTLNLSVRTVAYIKKELKKYEICKIAYAKNHKTVIEFTDKFIRNFITEES